MTGRRWDDCPNGCDLETYWGTHATDCPLIPDPQPTGFCTCIHRPEPTCEIPSHRSAAERGDGVA